MTLFRLILFALLIAGFSGEVAAYDPIGDMKNDLCVPDDGNCSTNYDAIPAFFVHLTGLVLGFVIANGARSIKNFVTIESVLCFFLSLACFVGFFSWFTRDISTAVIFSAIATSLSIWHFAKIEHAERLVREEEDKKKTLELTDRVNSFANAARVNAELEMLKRWEKTQQGDPPIASQQNKYHKSEEESKSLAEKAVREQADRQAKEQAAHIAAEKAASERAEKQKRELAELHAREVEKIEAKKSEQKNALISPNRQHQFDVRGKELLAVYNKEVDELAVQLAKEAGFVKSVPDVIRMDAIRKITHSRTKAELSLIGKYDTSFLSYSETLQYRLIGMGYKFESEYAVSPDGVHTKVITSFDLQRLLEQSGYQSDS